MFPMQSKAATVAEYLDSLPPDRRAAISAVRDVILQNLDDLPLEVIGEAIRRVPARTYVEQYTKAMAERRR